MSRPIVICKHVCTPPNQVVRLMSGEAICYLCCCFGVCGNSPYGLQTHSLRRALSPNCSSSEVAVRPAKAQDVPKMVLVINEAFMVDTFFKKKEWYNRTSVEAAQVSAVDSRLPWLPPSSPNMYPVGVPQHWDRDQTPSDANMRFSEARHFQ